MSREEHLWLLNEFDEVFFFFFFFPCSSQCCLVKVVKKHFPRILRAVSVYILLSIVPWVVYGVLSASMFQYYSPVLIVVPLVLQLLNVMGFVWWVHVKRQCFKKVGLLVLLFCFCFVLLCFACFEVAVSSLFHLLLEKALVEKAEALNAHFAGRGINIIAKSTSEGNNCNDKIVIEVAARSAMTIPPHVLAAAASSNQVYQTIDHLPPHAIAIPMQNFAPPPVYG
jgi:hypothetical protein